ncbi:uncharacterized protein ACA1_020520 [Acanthamoeba castellanii str. Neff]|uniref:Uncharacterized protein n=1 Tax=Acanthamoeba castellanii (strain ATCC 30010 / Neff) TaxID=1257118 RepID=L8GY54_ACACF|nr:uncharacterized protein ACA1_020520 [Acanthamoeba castellanii str. Neff]ELR17016.1 hypothetical protein ACA1_020520 [Acanthamoeba castellanii str. Neff]
MQIDVFVTSKGQPNRLMVLDGTGNIPGSQLGNAYAPLVTKGALIMGNSTTLTILPLGTMNQLLTADTNATNGIKWAQGDHTTLNNVGTNTHAQIDTFIGSKGAASGLALLDALSFVLVVQLGNMGSTMPVAMLLTIVCPWTEARWAGDLNVLKTTGTLVPMYLGAINGGANNTYFVNLTDHTQQPHAIEIMLKNTCTVLLIVDPGNSAQLLLNGGYYLELGTHTFMVLALAFMLCSITMGTYMDKWSGGNSITYVEATRMDHQKTWHVM